MIIDLLLRTAGVGLLLVAGWALGTDGQLWVTLLLIIAGAVPLAAIELRAEAAGARGAQTRETLHVCGATGFRCELLDELRAAEAKQADPEGPREP